MRSGCVLLLMFLVALAEASARGYYQISTSAEASAYRISTSIMYAHNTCECDELVISSVQMGHTMHTKQPPHTNEHLVHRT